MSETAKAIWLMIYGPYGGEVNPELIRLIEAHDAQLVADTTAKLVVNSFTDPKMFQKLIDERVAERLADLTKPSPCGVLGHRMADWVEEISDRAGWNYDAHRTDYCSACEREERERALAVGAALEQELQVLKTWLCKAHLPTQAHPGGTCFVCNALKMSAAERSATLREAAAHCLNISHLFDWRYPGKTVSDHILALIDPATQSALDRERAEARQPLVQALEKIIEMNRQNAADKYGNPDSAEMWACVVVARAALRQAAEKP